MTNFEDPLASANAFIRNAFIITPWTSLAEVQRTYSTIKPHEGFWGARVHQGLSTDRLYVAERMEGERIAHWAVCLRCLTPQAFSSTQASIAAQLNHSYGKAKERWESGGVRYRRFHPNPAESVTLCRRSSNERGSGFILSLSRRVLQPAEDYWRPGSLDDLAG